MRGMSFEVKSLITKAREAAILAVETYNRPTATFRSGAFVVLMVVAWTALYQAIFLKRHKRPFYKKKNSRFYEKIDGDYRAWELKECISQFHGSKNPPQKSNQLFFVGLRNKIEHRSLPQLDPVIFGECQAFLLNFEELLCGEFGNRFALKTGLVFALQFSDVLHTAQSKAMTTFSEKQFKTVKRYVDTFRSSLSDDVGKDQKYSFRVFLVPKVNNHVKSADVAVEFVRYDASRPEEMKKYEHLVTFIKEKQVPVVNLGYLRPTQVIKEITERTGKKFSHYDHQLCFRHFHVRPKTGAEDPTFTDARYCFYDEVHKDYVYKPDWIEFLIQQLRKPSFLGDLYNSKDTILATKE
ncbi:MAG: DUF3644 domain-containing protein [bacterium]